MADVAATLAGWSSTTASNSPAGSTSIGTGLDDNLREIQGVVVRGLSHKGADIASVAGTTDIGAVEGLMHDITGANAITGLGTVRAGILKVLKFEGSLTLTHNSTSLILYGQNITTENGDVGVFISEGSGNWRCLGYFKAAKGAYQTGGWEEISRATASAAATVDVTLPTGFKRFRLEIIDAAPATDAVEPWLRFSDDAGSTFEADASDYSWSSSGGGSSSVENSTADTEIALAGSVTVGNATGERCGLTVMIDGAESATNFTSIYAVGYVINGSAAPVNVTTAGKMNTASSDEAVRFMFSSGNVASGTFILYGMR